MNYLSKLVFKRAISLGILLTLCLFMVQLSACTPRVEIAPPNEPITINLNIKIDHEVKVKVEKDLEEDVFSEEAGLF